MTNKVIKAERESDRDDERRKAKAIKSIERVNL
jgi:hypothetical protein